MPRRYALSFAARTAVESLEARRLLSSVLDIQGTEAGDLIRVWMSGGLLRVTIDGVTTSYDPSLYTGIHVQAFGGDDDIFLEALPAAFTQVSVDAGDGHDWISGCDVSESLFGGAGEDTLIGGGGADTLSGGSDVDLLIYADRTESISVTFNELPDDGEAGENDNVLNDIEIIECGSGNDRVDASDLSYPVTLFGNYGNDSLHGGSGDDWIEGNFGNDNLYGNGGDDFLNGGLGADLIDGGAGTDTTTYEMRFRDLAITIDDVANDGEPGELDNVTTTTENVIGGWGNDFIRGSSANNALYGAYGDDTLSGGLGDDTLSGGDGRDTVSYAGRTENLNVSLDGLANDGAAGESDLIDLDIEHVIGGSGNDFISGDANANEINGGAGNDTIDGGLGADTIVGGAGQDFVSYATRIEPLWITLDGQANDGAQGESDWIALDVEHVIGGAGNDSIVGSSGNNDLRGGDGADTIDGGLGADTISGGSGWDVVTYASRTANLSVTLDGIANDGEAGEGDWIGDGIDIIIGGSGNDFLSGNSAANGLHGGAGNDTIEGGLGRDTLSGGAGEDFVSYATHSAGVSITLDGIANDGAAGENDNVNADFEHVIGGAGSDSIVGNDGANELRGGGGDDTLDGGLGADTFIGGGGTDTVTYASRTVDLSLTLDGLANDGASAEGDFLSSGIEILIAGSGNDSIIGNSEANGLFGGGGNDTINGGLGAASDTISGGAGSDWVSYAGRTQNLHIRLDGYANDGMPGENDHLYGDIENVIGGHGSDTIFGNDAPNVIYGGVGYDVLRGLGGNDTLYGQAGNDSLIGADGDDVLDGGDGPDAIYGQEGNDTLYGGIGRDKMFGGNGDDWMKGLHHDDTMLGEDGNDRIYGDHGNDSIDGGNHNDTIFGSTGNDRLFGGPGSDRLYGESGNDFLDGGLHNDRLEGGPGTDSAVLDVLDQRISIEILI